MSLFTSNEEHFSTPFALHNHQTNKPTGQIKIERLEPENDLGNVEYKLRLTDPTPERIEKLVTQLKWRIKEGNGEAVVYLGVRDDGIFVGLTKEERQLSLQTLGLMTTKIGAKMFIVNEKTIYPSDEDMKNMKNMFPQLSSSVTDTSQDKTGLAENSGLVDNDENTNSPESCKFRKQSIVRSRKKIRKVLQILVKRKTLDISEELRVAVLGPTGCGKSSLLGTLSHGQLDNGCGSARLNLFRHRHEIRSGHTSSISQQILGFDSYGKPLTYQTCLSSEEILESSSRIVTLIDLAGHQRYLNTTLFGLGSYSPDLVLLVVTPMSQITNTIAENLSLALGMGKSLAVVVNKIDLVPDDIMQSCCDEINRVIKSVNPTIQTCKVEPENNASYLASNFRDNQTVPIFLTSCVSGSGLNDLYSFFYEMSPRLSSSEINNAIEKPAELQVDETFEIPAIGTVVSGLLIEGIIREGDDMLIGPDDLANFSPVSIDSLQRHKIPCNMVRAGQKCTMAITTPSGFKVRRGMVLKEKGYPNLSACLQFEARVKFVNGKLEKLKSGTQASVYVANVKQTTILESFKPLADNLFLLDMRLTKRPEYIRIGANLVVTFGTSKAVGNVISVREMIE